MTSIEKTYQNVQDGRKITVRIDRRRGRYYNNWTLTLDGKPPLSGTVPKGRNCEDVLTAWLDGECINTNTGHRIR